MLTPDADWAQRYRPTRLEDLILPTALTEKLRRVVGSTGGMSLLFYGAPGCGKTTAAGLINPMNTYFVNCATNNSIEMVRGLSRTCTSGPLVGGRRLILLDEADSLTKDAQTALRGVIETLSPVNDFVMTANRLDRLIDAIRSRCLPVSFEALRDPDLLSRIEARLSTILKAEGHAKPAPGLVKAIVQREFPDVRRMLKCLQFDVGEGL